MDGTSDQIPSAQAIRAWARLLRVSRQFLEKTEEALKKEGLPALAWYDALHEIAEAGEAGLRPFQLVDRMLLAQYNVSRMLARLADEGLIERLGVEADGRGQSVRITKNGLEMRRKMWAVYGRTIAELADRKLSARELQELEQLLGKLRQSSK